MEEERRGQVFADLEVERVLPLCLYVVMTGIAGIERGIVEETCLVGDVLRDGIVEIDGHLRTIVAIEMVEGGFSLLLSLLRGDLATLLQDGVVHDIAEVIGDGTDVDGQTALFEGLGPVHTKRELSVGGREEG